GCSYRARESSSCAPMKSAIAGSRSARPESPPGLNHENSTSSRDPKLSLARPPPLADTECDRMGDLRSQRSPQPAISIRQASLSAYQQGLRELAKYAPDMQRKLKLRVFETFDRLMRHRGMAGLVRGMSLLDLGSADGTFVAICRERGIDAVGVDAEEGVDLERDVLSYRDGSIDVITAISVIEHLSSAAQLLRESYRVLKPGGAIIIVCPNWRYSWRAFYDDPTHVHPYTERSLARGLANF